jgi:GGDEF domain-containing protein
MPVSISFGIASAEDAGVVDPESLLKRADNALYEAKKSRNSTPRPLPETSCEKQSIIDFPAKKTEGAQEHGA